MFLPQAPRGFPLPTSLIAFQAQGLKDYKEKGGPFSPPGVASYIIGIIGSLEYSLKGLLPYSSCQWDPHWDEARSSTPATSQKETR